MRDTVRYVLPGEAIRATSAVAILFAIAGFSMTLLFVAWGADILRERTALGFVLSLLLILSCATVCGLRDHHRRAPARAGSTSSRP